MNDCLFSIVPIDVFQARDLTLDEIRVLGTLMSFLDGAARVVWPGAGPLALRSGYSERKVRRVVEILVDKGWISRTTCIPVETLANLAEAA